MPVPVHMSHPNSEHIFNPSSGASHINSIFCTYATALSALSHPPGAYHSLPEANLLIPPTYTLSLGIFENPSKISPKKPKILLRGIMTCLIPVLVHTSHLTSGTHLSSEFWHTSFLWIIYVILRPAVIVQHSLHSAYTLCLTPVFIHIFKISFG